MIFVYRVDTVKIMNGLHRLFFSSFRLRSIDDIRFFPLEKNLNVTLVDPINERSDPISFIPTLNFDITNLFIQNRYSEQKGGAVHYNDPGWTTPKFRIFNTTFFNCSSNLDGGAMYIFRASELIINQSVYDSTKGSSGGAKYLSTISSVSVVDSQFNNSMATSYGGSLYITTSNQVVIEKDIFVRSKSDVHGGALSIFQITNSLLIKNCVFDSCYASSYGGAIYLGSISAGDVSIIECIVYNCSSNSRGGFLYASISISLKIFKLCAYKTSTTSYGHVIYTAISSAKYVFNNFSSFVECGKSAGYGAHYSETNMLEYNYINFSKNTAQYSSAIHTSGYGCTFSYCTLDSNVASVEKIITVTLQSNSGTFWYMNFCENSITQSSKPYIYLSSNSVAYVFTFQFCIFQTSQNTNHILFNGENSNVLYYVKNCYIKNHPTLTSGGQYYFQLTTTGTTNTETHVINHYSTYLCKTPDSLGQQEVEPCQTIPPAPTTINLSDISCQNPPASPTNCIYESSLDPSLLLSGIFQILIIQLIL